MSSATERYQNLSLGESLTRIYQYPRACKELSCILRGAYAKLPKNPQSLIFQDTLTAFRMLPEMQTGSAVAAAHILLQSAEASLPKQKKSLVVTEFKHAKVAHKRRSKARREEIGSMQHLDQTKFHGSGNLPQDVLLHMFSFLDLQSLIPLALVCRSWNLAANDNALWQLQYTRVFGKSDGCSGTKMQQGDGLVKEDFTFLEMNVVTHAHINWKEAFRKAYIGSFSKTLISDRGYCSHCDTIVWLKNFKCSNRQCKSKYESQPIKPVSAHQVAAYIIDGYLSVMSSSDSDSEPDEEPVSRLWAYPRNISRYEKNPIPISI